MQQLEIRFEGENEPRVIAAPTDTALLTRLGKEMEQHSKAWPFRRTMLGTVRANHQFLILRPAQEMDYPYNWAVEYGVLGILDSTVTYGPHPQCVITFMRRARLFITEVSQSAADVINGGP